MKIAICGNVAQNAFLLAKGLRRLGIDADSYDQGGGYPLQHPAWQEAFFAAAEVPIGAEFWDWANLPTKNHWRRPAWAKILGNDGAEPWYDTQEAFQADLARLFRGGRHLRPPKEQAHDLLAAVQASRTPLDQHAAVVRDAAEQWDWRSMLAIAQQYDLVVLCGEYAAYGPLLPKEQPYVCFEHATMRYTPSLATPAHRLLALAYQQSDANVITNADCWEAAGMLGVRHKSVFIPHPLDEELCSPGDAATSAKHKAQVQAQLGCELVLFAPARHSRSEATGSKRNDRILYAFARYVREAEPAGAPKAGLLLCGWGHPEHVQESEALVAALGLGQRVGWLPCEPKPRLVRFYRLADIVLDQFSETVGSFGAVTAEAMACAKPVITYYSDAAHAWCRDVLPEPPPVVTARTTDDIYLALRSLAEQPQRRGALGGAGHAWIERWHSLKRVCRLHEQLYGRVLAAAERQTAAAEGVAA